MATHTVALAHTNHKLPLWGKLVPSYCHTSHQIFPRTIIRGKSHQTPHELTHNRVWCCTTEPPRWATYAQTCYVRAYAHGYHYIASLSPPTSRPTLHTYRHTNVRMYAHGLQNISSLHLSPPDLTLNTVYARTYIRTYAHRLRNIPLTS